MPSTNKVSHRESKKLECRQAIARAAVRLFEEKGFDATTTDEIAQAANVSRPTVFNYFARKDDILSVLGAMMAERLGTQTEGLQAGSTEDPLGTVKRIIMTMAIAFAEYPETSRAFHYLRMQESRLHKATFKCPDGQSGSPFQEQKRSFMVLIARAQQQGAIRSDFSAGELSYHLLIGLFASTIGPWLQGAYGDEPLPRIVERHFDLYLGGMRP